MRLKAVRCRAGWKLIDALESGVSMSLKAARW